MALHLGMPDSQSLAVTDNDGKRGMTASNGNASSSGSTGSIQLFM